MNKCYYFILLFCSLTINVFAQDLIPFRVNDKWGFSNSKGELVIEATYDSVGIFNPNRLLRKNVSIVKKNGVFNIINEQNVPLFDYGLNLKYIDLIESHIIVKRADNKFVAYDIFKQQLDSRAFDSYDDHTGYTLSIEINDKIGLIDYKLKTIIPTEYDYMYYQWFYDRGYGSEEVIAAIFDNLEPTVIDNELYVDNEKVDYNRSMMILTVVNENESKRVLKYIETLSDNAMFEEDIEYSTINSASDDSIKDNYKSKKAKLPYEFTKCSDDSSLCIFGKESKKGIYNLKTKKESELYKYIYPNIYFKYFTVTRDSNEGLIDENFEVLLPNIYKNIDFDYQSDYLVYAQKEGELYDYYNLKTKKYIYKDSEYKKGNYIYGGSSEGKYFFPVEKNGEFYYVDEDGLEYKKPN